MTCALALSGAIDADGSASDARRSEPNGTLASATPRSENVTVPVGGGPPSAPRSEALMVAGAPNTGVTGSEEVYMAATNLPTVNCMLVALGAVLASPLYLALTV